MKTNIKKLLILSLLVINPLSLYFTTNVLLADASHQEECSICLNNIDQFADHSILGCSHKFHNECINNWISDGPHIAYGHQATCPNCRAPIGNFSQENNVSEVNNREERQEQVHEPVVNRPAIETTIVRPIRPPQLSNTQLSDNRTVAQATNNTAREFRIQRRRPTLNGVNSQHARSTQNVRPNSRRSSRENIRREKAKKRLKKAHKQKILKLKKILLKRAKNKFRCKTHRDMLIKKYVQSRIRKARATAIR